MELNEYIDDYMTDHFRANKDDLLEDIRYTFEEDVEDISKLPRDIKMALDEIDLEWVIQNHIDCCSYTGEIADAIEAYAYYHADCDEIICEYGICRAVRDYWEDEDDSESDLAYRILIDSYDYSEGDIYEAIYDDAVEYICDELREWFLEFTTTEANDFKSMQVLCNKHDIDYIVEDESTIVVQGLNSNGHTALARFTFESGYAPTIESGCYSSKFGFVSIDDEDYKTICVYESNYNKLGEVQLP